jgi:ferredoxin
MADRLARLPENAPGRFYVDTQCIDCDVCRVTAPASFQRSEEKAYSYVYRQPATAEEEALCEEAMDCCPVEAIGKDGAEPAFRGQQDEESRTRGGEVRDPSLRSG